MAKGNCKTKVSGGTMPEVIELDLTVGDIQRTFPLVKKHSNVKGVSWKTQNQKWVAQVYFNHALKYLGYYSDEQGAIDAVEAFRKKHPKPPKKEKVKVKKQSPVVGVRWRYYVQKWQAGVKLDNEYHHLGLFEEESDAIKAVKEFRDKNPPLDCSKYRQSIIPKQGYSSKYKGVHWKKKRKKYIAQITFKYKNIHIGYFHDELEAARAYDKKAIELFGDDAMTNAKYFKI